ncbi:hypothetical protein [Methylobacillus glycogenes]|uniref:hypothetical protein n=1 Tax=Methylobacillus glycogenes TaxID=406 RepID=UPI000AACA083|nr:hypothetical protein [Methylobacillus glycogenes]
MTAKLSPPVSIIRHGGYQLLKLAGLGVLMLLSVVLLDACSRDQGRQEIRSVVSQLPQTLDPRYATDAASSRVNHLLYRSLVDFDEHSSRAQRWPTGAYSRHDCSAFPWVSRGASFMMAAT